MVVKLCLFVCFVLCIGCVDVSFGQVATMCRPKERFLLCGGCQKTCRDPTPQCKGVCRIGCYCNEDEVRNDDGVCVKLADCPPNSLTDMMDTSEPRPKGSACPELEEYRFCEPCNKTCDQPNPICPAQCASGCFCKDDLVRDRDGKCVKVEFCQNATNKTDVKLTCAQNHWDLECQNCERTCSNPKPQCASRCARECFCKDGLVMAPNGQCTPLDKCPQAEMMMGGAHRPSIEDCGPNEEYFTCGSCEPSCLDPNPLCKQKVCIKGCQCRPPLLRHHSGACLMAKDCVKQMTMGVAHEPRIEDCGPNEEYFACGWCEPTCSEPNPHCSQKVCIRGCLCRPPLLRHHSGACLESKDCVTQKCQDPNEEFVCKYGCETRCDKPICPPSKPRRCRLGCHCKLGLLRDRETGKCIYPEYCASNVTQTPTIVRMQAAERARNGQSMPHHL